MDVQIRWLIRADMPDVIAIENGCFEFPWNDEEFLNCLRQRNCIGMVAEHKKEIVGFMIYELHHNRLNILNFAVRPVYHRSAIGTQMIARLVDKLSQQRRQEIWTEVRERNVAAQAFFNRMGFVARTILRSKYEDTDEDCYVFCYSLVEPRSETESESVPGHNRIWKWVSKNESHKRRKRNP